MAGTEGVAAEAVTSTAYASPARSLGDPGITPLSPSHIAKDSESNDAEELSFLVIVAIDFGTTSSGYAYSFTKEPECIHVMRRWEGGDPGVSNQKTPTTILLTPERKFHSFGFAARDFYHDLDPNESKHWLYFEKFKMKLHTTSTLSLETDLTAANGKKVKALEIFAYALQYFKEQALKELSDQGGEAIDNSEIRWVITVPAIWKQPAKQFMRHAAYKAGMASPENPEQLIIALEPEAASIYCRKLRLHQMIDLSSKGPVNGYNPSETIGTGFTPAKEHIRRNRQSRTFLVENVIGEIWSELEEGDRYIVVDSGGGTVDVTVHQIRLPEGHLKELYKATGGPHGSLGVDYEFEKLLCKIFGEDFIEQFKIKRPAAWVDLMIAFESRKRAAAPERTNPLNITLPFSFIDYYKKFRGHSVEHALRKSNVDFVKWSSQGMLRMSPDAMNALFKPTIDEIINHLSDLFEKPEVTNVKFLFLVGGFAEAPLLQQAIQNAFGSKCRIIIPQDVGLTILKGAVLFGLDPAVIKVRRSPLTYGVGVLNRYVEGKHPPEKLLVKDGTRWCTDVFDKFISADQSVSLGETVSRSYTPAKPSQLVIVINIYSSEHDNVSFITEPGVKKCGTLRLDLTGTDINVPSRREIKTLMQFGDTEIKAMAVDVATSKSVKAGYIPLRYYRIGTSFGNDSVWCVNTFRDVTQRKSNQVNALRYAAATDPQLPPICSNEDVINVLDDYNYKHHPNVLGPVETKRSLLEPPIPGWTGFVPRSRVTEFGQGVRYHVMAENCYQDFKNSLDRVKYGPATREEMKEVQVTKPKESHPHQRFYRPEGMLPKYTGHIPHERSGIGKTFGNVCRSCSVCNHSDVSYGAYLAKKHKAENVQEPMKEDKEASVS